MDRSLLPFICAMPLVALAACDDPVQPDPIPIEVQILAPADGESMEAGDSVRLLGRAVASDIGVIPDDSLEWTEGGIELAIGAEAKVSFRLGEHPIVLTARYGQRRATDTVRVVAEPVQLGRVLWKTPLSHVEWPNTTLGSEGLYVLEEGGGDLVHVGFDGSVRWRRDLDRSLRGQRPVIASDGSVVLGSLTGDVIHMTPDGIEFSRARTSDFAPEDNGLVISFGNLALDGEGTAYVGTEERDAPIYALEADGDLKWRTPLQDGSGLGKIISPVILAGDSLAVTIDRKGQLGAISVDRGEVRWTMQLLRSGRVSRSPGIWTPGIDPDGNLIVARFDAFMSISPRGDVLWDRSGSIDARSGGPVVSNERIYLVNDRGGVVVFDLHGREVLRFGPEPSEFEGFVGHATLARGEIVYTVASDSLRSFHRDGTPRYSVAMDAGQGEFWGGGGPVLDDRGNVYYRASGELVAIRDTLGPATAFPWPEFQGGPERRGARQR